jgi:methionyl aminopeptidase
MQDLIKAGKIASQTLEYSKTLIKENASVKEIIEKIEDQIISLGAKPAFPAQLSINEMAAHFLPLQEVTLKKSDLVKIDLGVSINGHIGDTAATLEVTTNNHKKLIEASEKALKAAIETIKPGIEVYEVGKVIESVIKSYGFNPIRNLSGHSITQYNLHSGITIPNYDNKDKTKLEKNMIIAIEPFATTGIGLIKESKPSGIFSLENKKPVRDFTTRKILFYIEKEYKTLPFSVSWLKKIFNPFRVTLAINTLEKENILHQYPQLIEKSNGIVSQAEHTLIVDNPPIILTYPK